MRPQRSVICIIYTVVCMGVDAFQLYSSVSKRRRYPYNYNTHQQQLSKTSSADDRNDDDDDGLERLKNTLTFTQFDTNSDGKVSLSELKMGLEKELKVCLIVHIICHQPDLIYICCNIKCFSTQQHINTWYTQCYICIFGLPDI